MENQLRQLGNLLDNLNSDVELSEEETTEQMFETLMQKMALLKRSLARKKCTNTKNPDAFEEVINDLKEEKPKGGPPPLQRDSPQQNIDRDESFNAELNNTLSTIKTGLTMSQKDMLFEEEQAEVQADRSFSTDISIVNMIGRLSLSNEEAADARKKGKGRKSKQKGKKPSELATYLHKLKGQLDAAWLLIKRKNYRLDERQVTFFLEFFVVNHNYREEIDIIFEFFFKLVEVRFGFSNKRTGNAAFLKTAASQNYFTKPCFESTLTS